MDNLQEFLAHLNGGSTAQSVIVVLVGMVVVWTLGAGVAVTVAGLIRATRKGASVLSAWWRKPGRLARIEAKLGEVAAGPRPGLALGWFRFTGSATNVRREQPIVDATICCDTAEGAVRFKDALDRFLHDHKA